MSFRFVVALAAAACAAVGLAQPTPAPKYAPDRVIVRFLPGTTSTTIQSVNTAIGATVKYYDQVNDFYVMKLRTGQSPLTAKNYYAANTSVKYASIDRRNTIMFVPNDPSISQGKAYGLTRINAFQAWDITKGKPSVKIAILDTGMVLGHPDFVGKIVDPFDAIDGDANPAPGANTFGDQHGTHCAGDAAANTNNGIGIASTGFNCSVMPVRVFKTADDGAFDTDIIRGINWAVSHNAKVISMSLGGPDNGFGPNPAFQDAVNNAWNKGVTVLAASGNSNSDGIFWPAFYNNVISVGATDRNDLKADFSNFGQRVDIAAPGVDIYSSITGGYELMSGTSMACPMAAGVVGAMWSVAPTGMTNAKLRTALFSTAKPVGTWLHYGLIDMYKAVRAVAVQKLDLAPVATPTVVEGSALPIVGNPFGAADSNFYQILPVSIANLGQVGSASYRFVLPVSVNRSQLSQLDFFMTERFDSSTTGQIYLLNWSTGKWEVLKAYPMTALSTTLTASLKSSFSTYVSAAGEIRALVRGLKPTSAGLTSNTFDLDYVKLGINYLSQ